MKQEAPTLTIKDIVLLKQYPNKYLEKELSEITNKTHDGTSITPVKEVMGNFIKEYGNSSWHHTAVYSSDGKKELMNEKYNEYEAKDYLEEHFSLPDGQDMHIIAHSGESSSSIREGMYDKDLNIIECLNEADIDYLTEQNADGSFKIRSTTITSNTENKESMTLIRDDNFSEADFNGINDTGAKMNSAVREHEKRFWNARKEKTEKYEQEWLDKHPEEDKVPYNVHEALSGKAYTETKNEMGDIYDMVKAEGYPEEFEKHHCKLRMRTNSDLSYNHEPDFDEYYDSINDDEGYDDDWPSGRAAAERDYDYGREGPNWASDDFL